MVEENQPGRGGEVKGSLHPEDIAPARGALICNTPGPKGANSVERVRCDCVGTSACAFKMRKDSLQTTNCSSEKSEAICECAKFQRQDLGRNSLDDRYR